MSVFNRLSVRPSECLSVYLFTAILVKLITIAACCEQKGNETDEPTGYISAYRLIDFYCLSRYYNQMTYIHGTLAI